MVAVLVPYGFDSHPGKFSHKGGKLMGNEFLFEPWLDPRFYDSFTGFGERPVSEGSSIRVELPVYQREGSSLSLVGTKTVMSLPLLSSDCPFMVRVKAPLELTVKPFELLSQLEEEVSTVCSIVRERMPGYYLTPIPASWHGKGELSLLFTKEFVKSNDTESMTMGRLGSYLGKLQPRSYRLAKDMILGFGDPSQSYYKDWDGVYFIKESALCTTPAGRVVQIYGILNPDEFLSKAATDTQGPVIWGVGLIVPNRFWNVILQGCGVAFDSPANVVSANRDHVKFVGSIPSQQTEVAGYELWVASDSFVNHRGFLVQEERQMLQLDEEAIGLIRQKRDEKVQSINDAFGRLAEGDRSSLLALVAKDLNEVDGNVEDVDDEDQHLSYEELEGIADTAMTFQSLRRFQAALYAGAPLTTDDVGQAWLHFVGKIKTTSWEGVTAFSFPTNVTKGGIFLPLSCKKRVSVGDVVTDIRYPNTGTGMLSVKVEGFNAIGCCCADPILGKEAQNEDYDGDISVVIFKQIVKGSVPKVPEDLQTLGYLKPVAKVKEIKGLSVVEQTVQSYLAKNLVGLADTMLKIAVSHGVKDMIEDCRLCVQTVVDMAKKGVDLEPLSVISEFYSEENAKNRLRLPAWLEVSSVRFRGETPIDLIKKVNRVGLAIVEARHSTKTPKVKRLFQAVEDLGLLKLSTPNSSQRRLQPEGITDKELVVNAFEKTISFLKNKPEHRELFVKMFKVYSEYLTLIYSGSDINKDRAFDLLRSLKEEIVTTPKWGVVLGLAVSCYLYKALEDVNEVPAFSTIRRLRKEASVEIRRTVNGDFRGQSGQSEDIPPMVGSFSIITSLPARVYGEDGRVIYDLADLLHRLGYVHDYKKIMNMSFPKKDEELK
jgi:hypothetical protein